MVFFRWTPKAVSWIMAEIKLFFITEQILKKFGCDSFLFQRQGTARF